MGNHLLIRPQAAYIALGINHDAASQPRLAVRHGGGAFFLAVPGRTGNHYQAGGSIRLGHAALLVKLDEINIGQAVAGQIDGILSVPAGKALVRAFGPGLARTFQQGAVGGTDIKSGGKRLQAVDKVPLAGARILGHHAQGAHVPARVVGGADNNQAAPGSLAHGIQPGLLHHAVHHFNSGLESLRPAAASQHAGGKSHHGNHDGDDDDQFHQGKPFSPCGKTKMCSSGMCGKISHTGHAGLNNDFWHATHFTRPRQSFFEKRGGRKCPHSNKIPQGIHHPVTPAGIIRPEK